MIRLKLTMGNSVKCKIAPECTISKYECSWLKSHPIGGLLDIHVDKGAGITFLGDTRHTLDEKLSNGIDRKALVNYVSQIIRIMLDVRNIGLSPKKLIFHEEWIFFDKSGSELRFIYCPINGCALQYDGILFMKDLVLQTNLGIEERKKWNQWLLEITKNGLNEKNAMSFVKKMEGSSKFQEYDYGKAEEECIGEELTGPADEDDDPLTDQEDAYDWMDDETPTGTEDDYIFGDNENLDGTYSRFDDPESGGYRKTNCAKITRCNTGESCEIMKNEFRIGRSEQRADFCVRGNNGVSNVHAIIICRGNQYYIKDNHSTNGTFVDGIKITDSSVQIPLRNGSLIRIYNEELIFNC